MSTNESNPDNSEFVINPYNQSVGITFYIEYQPIIFQNTTDGKLNFISFGDAQLDFTASSYQDISASSQSLCIIQKSHKVLFAITLTAFAYKYK